MSRLTFQIQDEAKLRAGERFSLAGLRAKLFGAPRQPAISHQIIPCTRKYGQARPAPAPVTRPSYFDAAPNNRAFVPAKFAKPAVVTVDPQSVEYKGHVIHAARLEDGRWAAFHHPIDADPAIVRDYPAPTAQRFMARVLAIASAEIEIDDLQTA